MSERDLARADTPAPHSTQEEHAFLWLERLVREAPFWVSADGSLFKIIPINESASNSLLAAIKAWREAGRR